MNNILLSAKNLSVGIKNKEILSDINLNIMPGETHVLLGPNGAGKSTLGNAIMGHPAYHISGGNIYFNSEDITSLPPDKRAKMGMFMTFQTPVEIPGISVAKFIRSAMEQCSGKRQNLFTVRKKIEEKMNLLNMDLSYADRDLNVGFSGGERKKTEILQMLMLEPKFAILDETDSGLDVDAVRTVSKGIKEFQKAGDGSLLIITHSAKILESIKVDYVHVIVKGCLVKTGNISLIEEINKNGFEKFGGGASQSLAGGKPIQSQMTANL
ncbi:Fe-S cluster assembly ATPase SufC [Treponema parvum]|uniref:Fe-S cluster assembly ATPase SufC n=1 Tax=Treponema parvum TaxID=138851 RepID=A0A975F3V6_9SPIR|nr:Fe-S cluster assembly ATPase SufC [Treponema parvum]QTQ14210.1 Fe-S cluster assembly ATPase SufC [Treponema parvum]